MPPTLDLVGVAAQGERSAASSGGGSGTRLAHHLQSLCHTEWLANIAAIMSCDRRPKQRLVGWHPQLVQDPRCAEFADAACCG
jgi:hypothetical protein